MSRRIKLISAPEGPPPSKRGAPSLNKVSWQVLMTEIAGQGWHHTDDADGVLPNNTASNLMKNEALRGAGYRVEATMRGAVLWVKVERDD